MSMQLNRREKLIALATAALLLLFLADQLVVGPAWAYRTELAAQVDRRDLQREQRERLVEGLASLEQRWSVLREAGLTDSAADAEANLLHALRDWGEASGITLTSLTPDRVEAADRLPRVHVRVSATGSMSQIVSLLTRIDAAALPVRISDLQLSTRREGDEQLTLQLRLSTLYVSDQAPAESRLWRQRS